MAFTAEQIIVTRLLSEVTKFKKIALGEGIPALIKPYLEKHCELLPLTEAQKQGERVDAVIVEAKQVSETGDICLLAGDKQLLTKESARRWIVATTHFDQEGEGKLVESVDEEPDCRECADLIITELGVVEVTELGFELREVAPGRSSDDVRNAVQASLHVADDLDLMELGS